MRKVRADKIMFGDTDSVRDVFSRIAKPFKIGGNAVQYVDYRKAGGKLVGLHLAPVKHAMLDVTAIAFPA